MKVPLLFLGLLAIATATKLKHLEQDCPNECPGGCCPEPNWTCCWDNILGCSPTAADCFVGTARLDLIKMVAKKNPIKMAAKKTPIKMAAKKSPIKMAAKKDGPCENECGAGSCCPPGTICCPDNLHCAQYRDCPSTCAEGSDCPWNEYYGDEYCCLDYYGDNWYCYPDWFC